MGQELKQEQKQQLILEAAAGFLLRCFGITVRQVLYVFALRSCEGSSGTFYVNRNIFPGSFQHGTLQYACSKSS